MGGVSNGNRATARCCVDCVGRAYGGGCRGGAAAAAADADEADKEDVVAGRGAVAGNDGGATAALAVSAERSMAVLGGTMGVCSPSGSFPLAAGDCLCHRHFSWTMKW